MPTSDQDPTPDAITYSQNQHAERLLGRRPSDGIPFDHPCELGFWCPVCRPEEPFDERLHWSEYNGFLWCEVCDFDYPSPLCVRLDIAPDRKRPWSNAGREDAVQVFLSVLADAAGKPSPPRLRTDEIPDDVATEPGF